MNERMPTVFLVDDDASVLKALARLIQTAGLEVATFASPEELLDNYDPNAPGCLILDLAMPGMNGIELQRLLSERECTLPIVFLTGAGSIALGVEAMKAGAADFLTKPVNADDLLQAIHKAIDVNRQTRRDRAVLESIRQRLATLTRREKEVLAAIVRGRLNKQIAYDLGTVEKTIKVHRARVMEKMQVQSLAELVRVVERVGMLDD